MDTNECRRSDNAGELASCLAALVEEIGREARTSMTLEMQDALSWANQLLCEEE